MKLALQLYSLRDYIQTEETLAETLRKVKEIGYDAVQLSGFGAITEEKLTWYDKYLSKHNLEPIVTHIPYHQLVEEFDLVVRFHIKLSIKYVGIGSLPNQYKRNNIRDYQEFIFEMNIIGRKLKEHGLTLVYHNHSFEFIRYGMITPYEIIIQNMDQSCIQVLPDLYWLQIAGINPITFINEHADLFDIVHIKDMNMEFVDEWNTKPIFAPVGSGNMGYEEIIKTLVHKNIEYLVVEQDNFYKNDPFNEIKRSYDFTQNALKNLNVSLDK